MTSCLFGDKPLLSTWANGDLLSIAPLVTISTGMSIKADKTISIFEDNAVENAIPKWQQLPMFESGHAFLQM